MRLFENCVRRLAPTAAAFALLSANTGTAGAQTVLTKLDAYQGSFSVDGRYVTVPGVGTGGQSSLAMDGSMFVQYFIPYTVTHKYPIVLIHGGVGAGQAFVSTPDGRTGWAQYFAKKGFAVYVVDQPGRGRSMYQQPVDGPVSTNTVLQMEQTFTASQKFDLWPQAKLHTQWPGTGLQGDPYFDAFMRGTMGALTTPGLQESLNVSTGAALIDRIGPAIVLGRSQSGNYPFHYADVRPHQIKAMIDIEGGAPAFNCPGSFGCSAYSGRPSQLAPLWGVTNTPITYSPPVTSPTTQIIRVPETKPAGPGLATCWRQGGSRVHKLVNLIGIPTMVMVSQSSFAAQTELCTHNFLTQAGVKNDFVRLQDYGIYGNGHLMNVEKNSDQIAQLLIDWLGKYGL